MFYPHHRDRHWGGKTTINTGTNIKIEPVHAKRYKMVKVFKFFFLHKTEEKCHRIYFLVFLLPKSEENLINDIIKCCQYNDKFYYVT